MGYLLTQCARIFEAAIISMGAHLAIIVSNIFFLGIPVMFSLGTYTFVILQRQGFSFLESAIYALGAVILSSFIFIVAYMKLSADSFTVFSLVSVLAFDALLKSWETMTGGVLGIAGIHRPEFVSSLKELVVLQLALTSLVLLVEYVLLKTRFGRALLGMKENVYIVQCLGYSTVRLGAIVIMITSVTAAVAGIVGIWRIRFLDPSFGGLILLIQVVTIVIIAAKPKVRWLAFSTLFIILLPEVLRFFDLPSSIIGHLRSLLYSLALVVVIKTISKRFVPQKRFI